MTIKESPVANDDDDDLDLGSAPASDRTVSKKDNAKKKATDADDLGDIETNDQLRSIVERIERLEAEKKTVADDIKEVYSEAKGNGYDTKVLRKVIAIRKRDRDEVAEENAILDLYLQALGVS
ncbi:MAG: DUF2312 domain-containing protein [Stutzerimonas stutzeri]|nr:MAG: DUF2312 domain-containing protein [Stutzerimonas stutzeri]